MSTNPRNVTSFKSNLILQNEILALILQAKSVNPMAPVTLLVDSPLQGTLLRRSVIALNSQGTPKAIANLKLMTTSDLVSHIANVANIPTPRVAKIEVLEAAIYYLMSKKENTEKSVESMATASAIATVYRQLQFVSESKLSALLSDERLSTTQQFVLDIVLQTRHMLSADSLSGVCFDLGEKLDGNSERLRTEIGEIHVLTQATPSAISALLDSYSAVAKVHFYKAEATENESTISSRNSILISAPDPLSEVSMVVRSVMHDLQKFDADKVAVLYPNASQYATQVRSALDEAGIAWHGSGKTIGQSSIIARGLEIILDTLAARNGNESGFTRPRFMKLIENGNLGIKGVKVNLNRVRSWVRSHDLYGDCFNWISVLDFASEADKRTQGEAKEDLEKLLKYLQEQFDEFDSCSNWTELGKKIVNFLADLYDMDSLIEEGGTEEKAWNTIKTLMEVELGELDRLPAGGESFVFSRDVTNLLRMVQRRVIQKRLREGNLSTGVMVGDIREAHLLSFDSVYVLGATEGMLPAATKQDALLPASILLLLEETDLAQNSRENTTENISSVLRTLLTDTRQVQISRPRGGMSGGLENEPSRFLAPELNEKKSPGSAQIYVAETYKHSFTLVIRGNLLGPVSQRELQFTRSAFKADKDQVFEASMAAWRTPAFNEYFGNLGQRASTEPVWSPKKSGKLSSSKIDKFIVCEYQFFVLNVLGFYDDERVDELREFIPSRFGTYFHKQMELFVKEQQEAGTLPGFGHPWPADTSEKFKQNYFFKNLDMFILTGRSGWYQSFMAHVEDVADALDFFFANEVSKTRTEPAPLKISGAEVPFGRDQDQGLVKVTDPETGEDFFLVGDIDRVDISSDGLVAGVLDFKTGSLDSFRGKIGITAKGGRSTRRTPGKEIKRETAQDIIYRLAALEINPDATSAQVNFAFIPNGGEPDILHAKFANDEDNFLLGILRRIAQSGRAGSFVPTVGSNSPHSNCNVCGIIGYPGAQVRGNSGSGEVEVEGEPNE